MPLLLISVLSIGSEPGQEGHSECPLPWNVPALTPLPPLSVQQWLSALHCMNEAALVLNGEQLVGCGPLSFLCSWEVGSQYRPSGSHRQKSLKATGGQEGHQHSFSMTDHTVGLGLTENSKLGAGPFATSDWVQVYAPTLPPATSLVIWISLVGCHLLKCSLLFISVVLSLHSAHPSTPAEWALN